MNVILIVLGFAQLVTESGEIEKYNNTNFRNNAKV